MKKIIIVLILLSAQPMFGQNNPIFFGGTGDGWNKASYLQPSNLTINHGGIGDGWDRASYLQTSTNINQGGSGDGWNMGSYLQASNLTLHRGGAGDGWNAGSYLQNTTTPSHAGGAGDGWSITTYLPALSQTLYNGGIGDGWASNVIPLGPLPVELLSFTGTEINQMHTLDWTTSMELNSSHFVIEHSVNATGFSELGMVNAAGNSSVESKYSFTNKKPVQGNNYYRLKMVDIDQQFKYSTIILLKLLKDQRSMVVYPNPAANLLNIELNGLIQNTKLQMQVMDASGKVLKLDEYSVDNKKYILDVSAYANGLYFLTIKGGTFSELVKFSISR